MRIQHTGLKGVSFYGAILASTLGSIGAAQAQSCESRCVTIAASGDALIRQSEPAKNFGASQALTTSSGAAGIRHALVRFDLSGVPEGADIVSASLVLHGLLYSGGSNVHPVVTPWDQATVTWLAMTAAPLLPAVAALPSINGGGVASADVRATVQDWIDGAIPNDGLLLERDATAGQIVYASSETPSASLRPQLNVCYEFCAPPPSTGPDALNCVCNNGEWIGLCADLDCSSGMAQDAICVPVCGGKGGLWATGCIDNSPLCSGN